MREETDCSLHALFGGPVLGRGTKDVAAEVCLTPNSLVEGLETSLQLGSEILGGT